MLESSQLQVPKAQSLPTSPIQEQHIDFVLEEEFVCNEAFLKFFLEEARKNIVPPLDGVDHKLRLTPCESWNCEAVRSASTSAGETDVLTTYMSADLDNPRVAILIEDKIRAGFQKDQAQRYRERGQAGQAAGLWNTFLTCLVAPQKYSSHNAGFDTRVSLETILSFFSEGDHRSRFKAGVLERALTRFASTGVQVIDPVITTFRAFYAQEAEKVLRVQEIQWELARDAWYDDGWFYFRAPAFPKGLKIVYKAKMGSVELSYANQSATALQNIFAKCSGQDGITTRQTGKSAAFCTLIEPIADFTDPVAALLIIKQSLTSVLKLLSFYKVNKHLLDV